jgi:polyhydroxyalkanoate synthesis repressor PhaR
MSDRSARGGAAPSVTPGAEAGPAPASPPVVVKKYANRRLYNTEASSYVTLEDLANMVRLGRDFVVYDAKSGEDITRSVLTQIIVEEESKGRNLLPESFLRQLIGFYGDSLQSLVPKYLESAMSGFAKQQEQMRKSVEQAMGGLIPFPGTFPPGFPAPFGTLEELGKQNMAMMERAMSLFAPFRGEPGAGANAPLPPAPEVEAMRHELESLRRQLAEMQAKGGSPAAKG